MMHGMYKEDGPREDLRFKGTLLRQDPEDPDYYLAQFDALYLHEAHGWHRFPKSAFCNINQSGDYGE